MTKIMFLEAYGETLSNVEALIIEWHSELGDVEAGVSILNSKGLRMVKRSWDKGNNNPFVDLYLKA
ncbi:MAG: hypothetical protein HYW01_00095 [Deltaproteobacteria bacterium]|nr:hypothetical protein [Deltaproteobacteria bacterium]